MSENGGFLYEMYFSSIQMASNSLENAAREQDGLRRTPSKSATGFVSIFDTSHSIGTKTHTSNQHIHVKR